MATFLPPYLPDGILKAIMPLFHITVFTLFLIAIGLLFHVLRTREGF